MIASPFETYHQLPRGNPDQTYDLVGGVETWGLRVMSNYENFRNWMKTLEKGTERKPQPLSGVVLTTPGKNQIRKRQRSILEEGADFAHRKQIPLVMVPDPAESQVVDWSRKPGDEKKMYPGSVRLARNRDLIGPHGRIIDGGAMLAEEAAIVLGAAVAGARNEGLRGVRYFDSISTYIERYLHFLQTGQELGDQ